MPRLPHSYNSNSRFCLTSSPSSFDVILTDQLKPILLEVNANPSLRIDFDHENEAGKFISQPSPIDEEIKKPLVLETLKLVMISGVIDSSITMPSIDMLYAQIFYKWKSFVVKPSTNVLFGNNSNLLLNNDSDGILA
ncbi:unnamed protein product [Rotaria magnacalcarata]